MYVRETILILVEISKWFPKSDTRESIQSVILRLHSKVHWFEYVVGREVFGFKKLYEFCNRVIDRQFQRFYFFARVL